MRTSLFIWAALMMVCSQSVAANHQCDDADTAERNNKTGPLQRALDSAKEDMDNAQTRKDSLDEELEGGQEKIAKALGKLVAAQAAERETLAKVDPLHDDYQQKALEVSQCVIGDGCTIEQKNQLALQLQTAGDLMLENDNANQSNINIRITMQREYDVAKSTVQFDSSSTQGDAERALLELNEAAATWQRIKDELEQVVSGGADAQKNCKVAQFNNDMHEIEKREALIIKCRSDDGCNAEDVANSGLIGFEYKKPFRVLTNSLSQEVSNEILGLGPKKFHETGKIRFPDCGAQMSKNCFKQHYKTYWLLDVLSVFALPISLSFCLVIEGYDYDLCLDSFPYVIVDSWARILAPVLSEKNRV